MNVNKFIEAAKAKNISEIEIRIQKTEAKEITLFDRKTDKYEVSNLEKIQIRGVYNGKIARISTENLENKSIDKALDLLIDNCKAISSEEPYVIFEGSPRYLKNPRKVQDFSKIDMSRKLNDLHQLHDIIENGDSRIAKIELSYSETKETVQLVNSKGLKLKKSYSYGVFLASADIADEGDVRNEYEYQVRYDYEKLDIKELANKMVNSLKSKLHPVQVESKTYPVILNNKVSISILGGFASIFSGLAAIRNMTLLKDKVGQKIFGSNITIVDDPLNANSVFLHTFDDQGVACEKREIVSKGVLKTLLHDLKTAKILNAKPTGNGFGGDIRPTNMFIKSGKYHEEELISSIEDGLYITEVAGLHEGLSAISGDLSLQASGYRIEKGKVTYPVSLIVISGNYLELLNNVEKIGDNLLFSPSGIGSPSLLIKGMKVSGK